MKKSIELKIGAGLLALIVVGCGDLSDHDGPVCDAWGDPGCPCTSSSECNDVGDQSYVCQFGICVRAACPEGTQGCPCGDACSDGLVCEGDICVSGCVEGTPGCVCREGGGCDADAAGNPMDCIDGTCQAPLCELGTRDCYCNAAGQCLDDSICYNGMCTADTGQTLVPPSAPKCWTPCRGGAVKGADGELVECLADGLMEGCIDGAECIDGTCLSAEEAENLDADEPVAPCNNDADCPQTQNCIDGACYSDCELDADCNGGRVCRLRACRLPCTTPTDDGDECGPGYRCDSPDGLTGVCLPSASTSTGEPEESNGIPPQAGIPSGTFPLSPEQLVFSEQRTSGTFTLTNLTDRRLTFTIEKTEETVVKDDGRVQRTEDALSWLAMGTEAETPEVVDSVSVALTAGAAVDVTLAQARRSDDAEWTGVLTVSAPGTAPVTLRLGYINSPEGQWSGTAYYLANFGKEQLDTWADAVAREDDDEADDVIPLVGNALIRRWWAFRTKSISLDEFTAVVTATIDETWKWPVCREFCDNDNAACYPSDNLAGFSVYSDDIAASPVPSGISQLDVTFNLKTYPGEPETWVGKIDSGRTLQYPGNPGVTLRFDDDPAACLLARDQDACLTIVRSLDAETVIGGRYPTVGDDTLCSEADDARFEQVEIPWLVPGFDKGTSLAQDGSGARSKYECRDGWLPLGREDSLRELNISLTAANPIPNGTTLRGRLELLDGALINGEELFILFRESLPEILPGQGATQAYGFMILRRGAADLEEADFEGYEPPQDPTPPAIDEPTCAPWLIEEILARKSVAEAEAALASGELPKPLVHQLASGTLEGVVRTSAPEVIDAEHPERVFYLCHDTGYIHASGDNSAADPYATAGEISRTGGHCPPGSRVSFFTVTLTDNFPENLTACNEKSGICRAGEMCAAEQQVLVCEDLPENDEDDEYDGDARTRCEQLGGCEINAPCPQKGDCVDTFNNWLNTWNQLDAEAREQHWFRPNPEWRCGEVTAKGEVVPADGISCDRNRWDLTDGKVFYARSEETPVFLPLNQAIDDAFRYKTRFKSRLTGTGVGFAPRICVGDTLPYCYDPEEIEHIKDRVDCLSHLYLGYYEALGDARLSTNNDKTLRAAVEEYLLKNFSYAQVIEPGRTAPTIYEGFEMLNAELLIMMGDESLTNAYSSRFDLAGQRMATFRGSLFEPDGIDLSGPAGYEMYSLYQAVQYYQMALDRLFTQTSTLAASLDPDVPGANFVSAATAVSWFAKLIRASSQKARAWARIADRYHGFERSIPAQRVIEKAYVTAYQESIFFSQLMGKVLERVEGTERAQVAEQIETAQLTYKDALITMQNVQKGLSNDVNVFGFTDTYIPFVALDPGEYNAFEKVMDRARERLDIAAEKEAVALDDRREFETDTAVFQAELMEIELDATSQLGDICGYFEVEGPDGTAVYPAVAEYAHFDDDERTRVLGDPCGLMGNGELAEALIELDQARLAIDQWQQRRANVLATAKDEEARIGEQCDRIESFADWRRGKGDDIVTWSFLSENLQATGNLLGRIREEISYQGDGFDCLIIVGVASGTNCPGKAARNIFYTASTIVLTALETAADFTVANANAAMTVLEQEIAVEEIREECDAAVIDGRYVINDLMRQVVELDLEGLQLAYDIRLKANRIETLRNQAISIQATQEEQTRLTIDVESARNDPNVRIYRNDAVINADRTFNAALREAYRATRMYEYYTNTTYAFRDRLPLVRMVANGDFPLDAYLDDLDEAFYQWEEQYGSPDLRVDVISAVDDIFHISRIDKGRQRCPGEMARLFGDRLAEAPRDERGAHILDFRTSIDRLSPLTHNHKIRFIEVEFVGEDLGDDLGRVYLRQRGDGVGFLLQPDGARKAYTLPVKTAVVDAFFNGERPLSDALGLFEGSTVDVYRNERLRDRPLHHSGWQLILNLEDEFVNRDIAPDRIEDIRIYLWYNDFTEM